MNFRSKQLADSISASTPHQTLIDMIDEFEGTIPAEHVYFFECLSAEIRQRLADIRDHSVSTGDVDRLPPDDAYQVEWEESPESQQHWRLIMAGDDNDARYHTEQDAVDAAWADYVENL